MSNELKDPGRSDTCHVQGVRWITLRQYADDRGPLCVLGQGAAELPFEPKRIFLTYAPTGSRRGRHAHRECQQLLICTTGSVKVLVDDGRKQAEFLLNGPQQALYIPPMVWAEQFDHSKDAVLLVLASHPYETSDYLRDHGEWLAILEKSDA